MWAQSALSPINTIAISTASVFINIFGQKEQPTFLGTAHQVPAYLPAVQSVVPLDRDGACFHILLVLKWRRITAVMSPKSVAGTHNEF